MKFTQISLLIAGFCLLTFVACQKDNALNDSNIAVPESVKEAFTRKCVTDELHEHEMATNPPSVFSPFGIKIFTSNCAVSKQQH